MKICFNNKTVLITGATRGIGKTLSEYMYNAGANLILTGTKQQEIDKLNAENQKKEIFNIKYLQADFSNSDSINLFLIKLEEFEYIDVCINNAGVNIINDFIDTSIEDFDRINDINLNVPYKILKVVGPKMLKNNYGRVVNVASIWSVVTRQSRSMYTTTKSALVGLTKAIATEWASNNIMVNAVSPGFTMTELTKKTNSIEQIEAITKIIPAQRMAEAIEIARVIAFLCSDLNTYLTGQNIVIDGGYTNV
jgi:3-oxoacyl-[acyl-carrier protein] reductase